MGAFRPLGSSAIPLHRRPAGQGRLGAGGFRRGDTTTIAPVPAPPHCRTFESPKDWPDGRSIAAVSA